MPRKAQSVVSSRTLGLFTSPYSCLSRPGLLLGCSCPGLLRVVLWLPIWPILPATWSKHGTPWKVWMEENKYFANTMDLDKFRIS